MTDSLLEQRREQMFPKLTGTQLTRIERQGVRLEPRAGEILADVGDPPRGFFVVAAGSVELLSPSSPTKKEGSDKPLFVLGPGDFTGEIATLRGTPALVRIRMRDAGIVYLISGEQLRRIVQSDAELSELFMRAFILRRMWILASGTTEIMVIGSQHSAGTLRLREFLIRNNRPYANVDVDQDVDANALLERFHLRTEDLPVVLCRGEKLFRNPSIAQVADWLSINAPVDDDHVHDFLIIGAGPAGLAAAVYAASEGLDVRVIEAFAPGGQAGASSRIENYLGFPTGISGAALAGRALSQALKFGARPSVAWSAARLRCDQWPYGVEMADGRSIRGRAILIATGAQYRTPDIANLSRYLGRGVYYAATHLEANLCAGEEVAVVGGGNSAGQAAVFLAGSCRHVHMLVRSDGLAESMSRYLIGRIEAAPNVSLHTRTQLTSLDGSEQLERVAWTRSDGTVETPEIRHMFLMTGAKPITGWLDGCVALDSHGFVKTGPDLSNGQPDASFWRWSRLPHLLETSVPGVFAAGDVRAGSVKRIASAVGEGSICVQFVHRVLPELHNTAEIQSAAKP